MKIIKNYNPLEIRPLLCACITPSILNITYAEMTSYSHDYFLITIAFFVGILVSLIHLIFIGFPLLYFFYRKNKLSLGTTVFSGFLSGIFPIYSVLTLTPPVFNALFFAGPIFGMLAGGIYWATYPNSDKIYKK